VREVSQKVFETILAGASLTSYKPQLPKLSGDLESYGNDKVEGLKKQRYTSYYERNPFYRNKAIEIHGLSCMACSANFNDLYGEWGAGFIHVHHNKPVSETGPTRINPRTDMSVVCPNCHAMIHRKKNVTLSVEEVRQMLQRRR
jgi:putative restriction endonuclease